MKTALWELQRGFYGALSTHQPLMNRVTGVFDDVIEGQAMPYVTLGEPTSTPWDTKNTIGENITWTLHCWSDYSGKKEAQEILNLMNEAFTAQPLSLDGGFYIAEFRREQMQVITDIDGQTKHGILRVRVRINQ